MLPRYCIKQLFFFLTYLFSINIHAQIPGISPEMLNEFNRMTPSQQKAIATRYGVNLDEIGIVDSLGIDEGLGSQGSEISPAINEILVERILESDKIMKKAEEYRRNLVPIFERDFSSVDDLPIYGQFLFDGNYSTFAPTDNAPVPSNYIIGTGDSFRVLLYGIDDSETLMVVNREGSINFPEIGEINLAGMTFSESVSYIKQRVAREMIGVEASISLGRLKSISVFMAGEAKIPGTYSVSGLSSLTQLLYTAGGITDIGSLRDIQVRRDGRTIVNFDLYRLLSQGDNSGDIRLQSGDIVFIPAVKNLIFIDGAIKRPGRYELKNYETIKDLIDLVGGFKSRAYKRKIQIERYDSALEVPMILNIDLTDESNLDFKLKNGDFLRVAEAGTDMKSSVILKGAVNRSGSYEWKENTRVSNIIKSVDGDLAENADTSKGLIVRRKEDNHYDIEVLDFNVRKAIDNSGSIFDPILNNYDQILIFSRGHNIDFMNDNQVYQPEIDMEHPEFFGVGGKNELTNNNESNINEEINNSPQGRDITNFDQRTKQDQKELEIYIYETNKKREFDKINQGKRRILLDEVIKKLNQQASSNEMAQTISISGAVKVPGVYPLIKNATNIDLIQLAGGYSDNAYVELAELRRTIIDSSGSMLIGTEDIDLKNSNSITLQSRDHLHIRSIKDWDTKDSVILSGEVFYPGTYLISPNETLSSVIKRAGGFTNESFIQGAVFYRESIKSKEREQLRILGDTIRREQAARSMTKESEDFSMSSSEVEASISALMTSEVFGRLIIDIPRLMQGDNLADIVLQDGDVLNIPKYNNAITVVGEVRRSGSFVRQESYNIQDYVELAAGMTARGDKDEIYIIRANGMVEKGNHRSSLMSFDSRSNNVLAGDTIVVPIKSSYQTPLNLYRTVSQVVFQSIASIAAFSSVLN